MAAHIHPATQSPTDPFTTATFAVPDDLIHSLRCAVCHNAVWIEDLQVVDGRPLCPTHYVERVTLTTPDGRGAVVLLG